MQRVHALVRDSSIAPEDAAVLVMLYALRYQSHSNNDIRGLVHTLSNRSGGSKSCVKVRQQELCRGEAARVVSR